MDLLLLLRGKRCKRVQKLYSKTRASMPSAEAAASLVKTHVHMQLQRAKHVAGCSWVPSTESPQAAPTATTKTTALLQAATNDWAYYRQHKKSALPTLPRWHNLFRTSPPSNSAQAPTCRPTPPRLMRGSCGAGSSRCRGGRPAACPPGCRRCAPPAPGPRGPEPG